MTTKFIFISTFFLATASVWAQSSKGYVSTFESTSDQAGWTQYRTANVDPTFEWSFATNFGLNGSNYLSHHWLVGGSSIVDDWMVSPGMSLPGGGNVDSLYNRWWGTGNPASSDTFAIYLLEGSQNPDLASKRTLVYDFIAEGSDFSTNDWSAINDITLPASNDSVYLAFRYRSTNTELDWDIDNLGITANATSSRPEIAKIDAIEIEIFPNPSTDYFSLSSLALDDVNITVELLSLSGEHLMTQSYNGQQIDVSNLPRGTYLVNIRTEEATTVKKLILLD